MSNPIARGCARHARSIGERLFDGVPDHGIKLDGSTVVIALELLRELEAEAAVDLHVGHVPAGLEVALHALLVSLVGHGLHHDAPNSFTLSLRRHDHDVEEVVPLRVGPDG